MSSESTIPVPETPSFAPRLYGIALLVAAIVITGIVLIARFAALDLARDMQTWQEKLNLIAESRTAEINQWVSSQFTELRSLAENPSLQLYLTELEIMPSGVASKQMQEAEPAQKTYLRNLLVFTADRAGYSAPGNVATIRANVQQESDSGLAVVNANNEIVVSTLMSPATRDSMLAQIKQMPPAQEGLIDLQMNSSGKSFMGFIVPIFSIQGEANANSQIGKVVGIKIIDNNLFGLLKHPGTTENSLETILVRMKGEDIEYLSPLLDGSSAMVKHVNADKGKLAEANLLETVGGFLTGKKDYRNKEVLATSRHIENTPWTLIVKIDRDEALAESGQRRASMVVFFFLIIAIIVLIIVTVWRNAHSKRSLMMSHHFRRIAAQARAQEELLRLVADHQPEPIFIVDTQQVCQFANQKAAEEADMSLEHMAGKTLNDICGTARASQINEQCKKSLKQQQIIYDIVELEKDKQEKIVRSAYVPIDHIPVVSLPENTPGVLIVEQDITEVVQERERRIATQQQLVQTLLKLVDKRDPFAANHSLLVSQIAQSVATDMEMDNITIETTRIAGSLLNIGKIVVPAELLTKNEKLSQEEKHIIRDSMNVAADLVKDISFDGPVSETLRQWQEKWDGTGPLGLKGEQILLSARIIAVANAFVGMISPRSWRTAIPIEAANKFLIEQSDTHFDRRVVIALINYVENHSGRAWLAQILHQQNAA